MLCQVFKNSLCLSCESVTSTLLCLVSRQRDNQRRKRLLPWHPGPAFSSQGSPSFHWWTPLHQNHPQKGLCVHNKSKDLCNHVQPQTETPTLSEAQRESNIHPLAQISKWPLLWQPIGSSNLGFRKSRIHRYPTSFWCASQKHPIQNKSLLLNLPYILYDTATIL